MKKSILGLILLFVVLNSCSKYSDGPSFSLLTKKARICNDWILITELRNDEDYTDENLVVKMAIDKDGTYSITETFNALGQLQGNYSFGKWVFGDAKDILYLYENENNEIPDDPTRTFKIQQLKNKEIKLVEEFPSIDLVKTFVYVQD